MGTVRQQKRRKDTGVLTGVTAALLTVGLGMTGYLRSPEHQLHDPFHALQQLDLLYLDQPAPAGDMLGLQRGRPALVVICRRCDPPRVDAQVRLTDDPAIARAYGLQRADGRVGPGYAVVDPRGRVRYRTFDPGLRAHDREIRILLNALR